MTSNKVNSQLVPLTTVKLTLNHVTQITGNSKGLRKEARVLSGNLQKK